MNWDDILTLEEKPAQPLVLVVDIYVYSRDKTARQGIGQESSSF